MRSLSLFGSVCVAALALGCGGGTPPADAPATSAAADAPPAPASTSAAAAEPAATPGAPSATPSAKAPAAADATKPTDAPLLGKLTDADIQDTLSKNFALFDPCYPDSLRKKNGLVKVTVNATIGPKGDANEVRVSKGSKDPKVDACVAAAFKKIRFPTSKDGSARVNPLTIELGGESYMTK